MKSALAIFALCCVTLSAGAQPVYRCGSEYSRTPCPSGGGKIVDATDPRTAAQRAEARRIAADERRLAAEMRRDRLAEQKTIKPAGATSLSGPTPATPASAAARHHKKKRATTPPPVTTDFVAIDPSTRKRRGGSKS